MFDKTLTVGRTFITVATIFRHGTYSSDDMSFGTMHSISGVHTHARMYFMNTARRNYFKPFGVVCADAEGSK